MSREGYREESSPFETERPSAAAEIIDEGREDFETRLDSSRRNLAVAEYAYQQALKEAGVSRRERRGLDGGGEGASKRELWSGREREATEELAGREFPHLLDRYRGAKAAYEENVLLSQRERVEGGPNKQEGIAQALAFRLEEKRQLQNAHYEARPKKERGLLWKTGAAVFRGFQALNRKINSLPPAARWAANVARWGTAGAIGGAGVVFAAPAVASLLGIPLTAGGLSAGAAIGMRVGRSIWGGFTGVLAAGIADTIGKNYMERRGLTRDQFQEEIEIVSRSYEQEGNLDALEKFLAEKGAELEEQYARIERAQKLTGYAKVAAAIIGGGVGGYYGYQRSVQALGQMFSGVPMAEAQTPVPPRAPGPSQADPLQKSAAGPQAPLTKQAVDRMVAETAGKKEKELLALLQGKDARMQITFKDDLARYKGFDWTKAGTQEELERGWAKWKAGHVARALHGDDLRKAASLPGAVGPEASTQPQPRGAAPQAVPAARPREAVPSASLPAAKPLFEQSIVNRARVGEAQGVENAFTKQIQADPKTFGFEKDLEVYKKKGSAWTKAGTPEAMQEEWAKWKAHRLALETGVVQRGKQILVLDQTPLGRKNASYVLEMQSDGKPKVIVVVEDGKGGYKAGPSFTPEHKWDGKPLKGYEYTSEPEKVSARRQQPETSQGRAGRNVLPDKPKAENTFAVKEGDHEFKILFRSDNIESLLREQGIQFDKKRGVFDLPNMQAGGGKFFGLAFDSEHGGVKTDHVEVYGRGKGIHGEITILVHNSDKTVENIVIRDGQIMSHTRNGIRIETPIQNSWDTRQLPRPVQPEGGGQEQTSWGPDRAPLPEGDDAAADQFGNVWRVAEHTRGTDHVLYETEITHLPDSLKGVMPKGVELVAITESPGGRYRNFGLYDASEGKPLILRVHAEEVAKLPHDTAALEYTLRAARERVNFIDAFTERNGWDRAVTANLVKDLEMGRPSQISMDFAKPDNVIPERIIFEVAPSRNGILLSMPMPDHRSPFSGQHFQSVAAERIEDLMDLSKKAGALASVRDQARILSEAIQSYAFDRKWDDVMKLNLRTIEIQAQEWQSRSDPSTWHTSKSHGAFAGWLVEQAEALKRQGVKLTPQTNVGTILDAIARGRA